MTLKAAPTGAIRYTLNGSSPRAGTIYGSEVQVPAGVELLLAVAEAGGEWSEQLRVLVPKGQPGAGTGSGDGPSIDRNRPAEWRRKIKCDDRRRSFEVLAILKRMNAKLGGVRIFAAMPKSSEEWIDLSFGISVTKPAEEIETLAGELVTHLGNGTQPDIQLNLQRLHFPSGHALIEAAKEMREQVRPEEVRQ